MQPPRGSLSSAGLLPAHAHAVETTPGGGSDTELEHGADEDVARLTRSFFSLPPADSAYESWEEGAAPPMTRDSRRAMYATLLILGASTLLLLGYLVYQRLIMPVPVALNAAAELPVIELPTPTPEPTPQLVASAAARPSPHSAAPQPANIATDAPAAAPQPTPALVPTLTLVPPPTPALVPPLPLPLPPTPAPNTLELLHDADALYARGQHKQALAAYEAVLEIDADAVPALSRLAYLHLNSGDDARARQYANRAVELDPTSSEGWIVLGAALEALRDRSGARDAYQKCAALGQGTYLAECRRLAR